MYLFKLMFSFSLGVCPGVELLDHMVVLFSVFQGPSMLLSTVAVPVYWRRKWQPAPVFLPEKSHGQTIAWWAIVYRVTKNWTWPSMHTQIAFVYLLTSSSLFYKTISIQIWAVWFFGTLFHHLLGLLAFPIMFPFLIITTCLSIYWSLMHLAVWDWSQ